MLLKELILLLALVEIVVDNTYVKLYILDTNMLSCIILVVIMTETRYSFRHD